VRALDETEVSKILDQMPSDDVVEVVEELPKEQAEKILDLMEEEKSEEVQELLEYGEGTAGRLMSPRFLAVNEHATVAQAIEHIRKAASRDEPFYLYVVDDHEHLVGVVPVHRLVTAEPTTPIRVIRTEDVESVTVETDQEEVARLVASYNLLAIPVVDESNKLVGVITVDDVIDVIKDEATEDLYRLAGVSGDERVFTPASESLRKRMPWLIVNLATAFLAAAVVGVFQQTIAAWVALAVFMPIVAGMGGNAATQTLTVIIRGIALGELTWSNSRKALFKNLLVGVGNGVVTGTIAALVAWLMNGDFRLGVILAMAMVINLFVAGLVGTLIPLGLKALKIDPALASAVFITTFTDVCGFASFLGLATLYTRYIQGAG
jgi:magnesium transporter